MEMLFYLVFGGLCAAAIIWFCKRQEKKKAEEFLAARQAMLAAQTREHQQKMKPHLDLEEHFYNSELVVDMLAFFCESTEQLPEEFLIYHDKVQCRVKDDCLTFDFAEHRIENLECVFFCYEQRHEIHYHVRPLMAMAEAINRHYDNQYRISDEPKLIFREESPTTYYSERVIMKLKSLLPNKTF